jgi:protein-S-isoprenylcysteine O-methyltransferase Ste14
MQQRHPFLAGYGVIIAGAVLENGILGTRYLMLGALWGLVWLGLGLAALVWAKRALKRSEGGVFLVQDGPYAWTRHPAAAAHFLGIMPGLCLILNTNIGILGILYAVYLFFQSVEEEEMELEEKFGEQYFAYKERVSRLIPCKI